MPPRRSSTRSRSSRPRSTSPPRFRSTSTGRPGQTSSAASPARGPRFGRAAISGLFVVGLGLRLWGINFGLPALYRPDEDVTVGVYVAYRAMTMGGVRPLLLNGVSLGIATSLKYNGAFVFAGIAAAQVLRSRAERSAWLPLAVRLVLIAAVGVGTLAVTSPFLVLDPAVTTHSLGYIFQHLATTSAPAIGYVELAIGLWFGIDPVLVLMGMIGIGYAAFRRQPADWILLTFMLIYFLVIGAGGSVFFRYADPLIPALLLLGG